MFILGMLLTIAIIILYFTACDKLANWLDSKNLVSYIPALIVLVYGGFLLGIATVVQILYSLEVFSTH